MVAFSNISQGKYNLSLKIFVAEIMWSYSLFLIWSLYYLNIKKNIIGFTSRFTFSETFYAVVTHESSLIVPDNNGYYEVFEYKYAVNSLQRKKNWFITIGFTMVCVKVISICVLWLYFISDKRFVCIPYVKHRKLH